MYVHAEKNQIYEKITTIRLFQSILGIIWFFLIWKKTIKDYEIFEALYFNNITILFSIVSIRVRKNMT